MKRVEMIVVSGMVLPALISACSEDVPTGNPENSLRPTTLHQAPAVGPSAGVASTELYACVNNSSGTIKIVTPGTTCENNHRLVSWPTGTAGGGGITGYVIAQNRRVLPNGFWNVHVQCPSGKKVLGGGFSIETPNDIKVFSSVPSDGNGNVIDHGWNVFVQNVGALDRQATAYAICAEGGPHVSK